MKLRTEGRERLAVSATSVIIAVVGWIAWYLGGVPGLVVVVALLFGFVVLTQMESAALVREQTQRSSWQEFRQVEALFSVFSTLNPVMPLPDTREWAASPDLLKKIIELVLGNQPETIIEAGSGVSTLVIGYCLKRIGRGRLISLDHDERFANKTRHALKLHGLESFATVLYCPLVPVAVSGESFSWYSFDPKGLTAPIDLLVVDGPPSGADEFPRYPVVPLLKAHLSDDAVILLDDGSRTGEARTAQRWNRELEPRICEFLPLEKGAFLLKRR